MRKDKMEKSDKKTITNDREGCLSPSKNPSKYSNFMIPETSTSALCTPLEAIEEET